jgi:hypothetical protein
MFRSIDQFRKHRHNRSVILDKGLNIDSKTIYRYSFMEDKGTYVNIVYYCFIYNDLL